jgi:hypothetical protein
VGLGNWLTERIARFLAKPLSAYELRSHNDMERLKRNICKGDVLLVEGDQRVSAVIKYLTQSSWSHAALFVGDDLVRRGGELRDLALDGFGDESRHVLVEALVDGGVVASPLSKYANFNVRLCRPHRLRSDDLVEILDDAVASIGSRYDLRNIVDLAVHLLRVSILPRHRQREALSLGSGGGSQVICTSLLGRLFHTVKFPVLPVVTYPDPPRDEAPQRWSFLRRRRRDRSLYEGVFHRRHPTLLTPRDFDLSPYFDIVKFNVIEDRAFDYLRIAWADETRVGGSGE